MGFGVANVAARVGDLLPRVGLTEPLLAPRESGTGGGASRLLARSRAVNPTYLLALLPGANLGGSGVLKGAVLGVLYAVDCRGPRCGLREGVSRPETGVKRPEATESERTFRGVSFVGATKTPQFGAQEK